MLLYTSYPIYCILHSELADLNEARVQVLFHNEVAWLWPLNFRRGWLLESLLQPSKDFDVRKEESLQRWWPSKIKTTFCPNFSVNSYCVILTIWKKHWEGKVLNFEHPWHFLIYFVIKSQAHHLLFMSQYICLTETIICRTNLSFNYDKPKW